MIDGKRIAMVLGKYDAGLPLIEGTEMEELCGDS
jgi:hypothetical protein